jgi:hypothetical protein
MELENMIIALGTLSVLALIFFGILMVQQDDLQREEIKNELDNKYGTR